MGFSPILIDLLLMTIRDTWRTEKDGFIQGEEKVNNDGEMEHFIFAKAYYPGQDHSLYLMTLLVYFGYTIFRRCTGSNILTDETITKRPIIRKK